MLTIGVNKAFWGKLSELGLKDAKEEIVLGISNGRTTSVKELKDIEVNEWLGNITQHKAAKEQEKDKIRKQLIAIVYGIGKDIIWLKVWILKQGKKELNDYTLSELIKYREVLKKIQKHTIGKIYTN